MCRCARPRYAESEPNLCMRSGSPSHIRRAAPPSAGPRRPVCGLCHTCVGIFHVGVYSSGDVVAIGDSLQHVPPLGAHVGKTVHSVVIRSVIFRPAGQQLILFISRIQVAETGAHGKCAGAHNVLRAPGLVVAYKFDKLFL